MRNVLCVALFISNGACNNISPASNSSATAPTMDLAPAIARADMTTAPSPPDMTVLPDLMPPCMGMGMLCGGKCVNLASDSSNCGACGNACPQGQVCAASACACVAPTVFCGGKCTDTSSDVSNCGACGNACNVGGFCAKGACACFGGEMSCAGACVSLASDASNCGACGTRCMPGEVCSAGVCTVQCGKPSKLCGNACVDIVDDPRNCGGCGNLCSSNHMRTVTCQQFCNGACLPNFADCNGDKFTDGCETDVLTDPINCGMCGVVCQPAPNATPACLGGACAFACNMGFADCDGNAANGCETDLLTDPDDCGGCNIVCAQGRSCVAGRCMLQCGNGRTACFNAYCADLTSDAANCGGCGNACPQGQVCAASACVLQQPPCQNGLVLCNGKCADTTSDAANCGGCGNACPQGQVCTASKCVPAPQPQTVFFGQASAQAQMACNGQLVLYVWGPNAKQYVSPPGQTLTVQDVMPWVGGTQASQNCNGVWVTGAKGSVITDRWVSYQLNGQERVVNARNCTCFDPKQVGSVVATAFVSDMVACGP